MKTKTVAGFIWMERKDTDETVWELQNMKGLHLTFFCLKNYGGKPGDGFNGWKLVSGGPFDDAGAYHTFAAAAKGVAPFLITYYKKQATEKLAESERIASALRKILKALPK